MQKVLAGITVSLDGYITGPNDGPGMGLGERGERLHSWVFGGPWSYGRERGTPAPIDEHYLDEVFGSGGAWRHRRPCSEGASACSTGSPAPISALNAPR